MGAAISSSHPGSCTGQSWEGFPPSSLLHCSDGLLAFVGGMFPAAYNMSIINAQHGSWNRMPKLGYRVMVLNLNDDGLAQNYSSLAEGWLLPNGTVWGESLLSDNGGVLDPLASCCFCSKAWQISAGWSGLAHSTVGLCAAV